MEDLCHEFSYFQSHVVPSTSAEGVDVKWYNLDEKAMKRNKPTLDGRAVIYYCKKLIENREDFFEESIKF